MEWFVSPPLYDWLKTDILRQSETSNDAVRYKTIH